MSRRKGWTKRELPPGSGRCGKCACCLRVRQMERGLHKDRSLQGFCYKCGLKKVGDDVAFSLCSPCRRVNRKNCNKRYYKNKNLGLCVKCATDFEGDGLLCGRCREMRRKAQRQSTKILRARKRAAKIALDAGGGLSGSMSIAPNALAITTAAVAAGTSASAMAAC